MGRIKEAALVRIWAERPDVFALERPHIQRRYAEAVEAESARLAKKGAAAKAKSTKHATPKNEDSTDEGATQA